LAPIPLERNKGCGSERVDFVCEEDVRLAIKEGRKIAIHAKTIVTPAARDLANEKGVFG